MLSYFGLVDDFAARHGDEAIETDSGLTQNLIFAVLFDEQLLINDGHIIASSVIGRAILDPKKSPLRKLVEAGYVQILTRNDRNLGDLTQHMADNGIKRAQELLKDRKHSSLNRTLRDWGATLDAKNKDGSYLSFQDWPAHNTSEVFERLAFAALDQAISNIDDRNHRQQLTEFGAVFGDCQRRNRTAWEEQVNRLRDAGKLPDNLRLTLLHIANEAYQYSWGCVLSTGKSPVKVFTRTPEFLAIDHSLTVGEMPRRKSVKVYAPDLRRAGKKVKHDWVRLAEVGQPGHDVCNSKRRFLTALEKYYTSPDVTQEEIDARAAEYSKALKLHFSGETVPLMFDLAFTGLSTAAGWFGGAAGGALVGAAAGGPIGAAVGLGVGFIGNIAAHMGGPKFIQRCSLPLQREWIRSGRKVQSTSCFQVQPETAAAFLEGVSTYKQ
jgi:hypothetical protein